MHVMNFFSVFMASHLKTADKLWTDSPASKNIIHQIFSLARDWSKRITWVNIPPLKLRNIQDYNPSNISLARDWSKRVTWANIPQLKLGNIRGYSPIFKTDFKDSSLTLKLMLGWQNGLLS